METIVKHKLTNIQKIPFIAKEDFVDLKAKALKSTYPLISIEQTEELAKLAEKEKEGNKDKF